MDKLKTKLFGEVPAPEDFGQILTLTSQHAGKRMNVYMWRGQADIDWPIHSAAYRRLNNSGRIVTENHVRAYEKRLLVRAAHQGYDYENGRKLSDLEVLAKLQHHGAATRLIDFSRNMLVSLWFACKSHPDSVGLLFGLHTDHLGGYEGELEIGGYDDTLGNPTLENLTHPQTWQPPVVTKRIAAQSAQFVYSSVSNDPAGSLSFEKKNNVFLAIALTPIFKSYAVKLLEGTFDIRHLTLFPDIDGFSYSNSEKFEIYSNDRW
ncbi:FRG domain-containing protein [Pantoea sp. AS-PWVM4]|uniref:FRG domain-containing protein n=1 Tax=Pantoea sp. AS-PWVM4 TaxID=1332069 RepID=UPI00056CB63C|nr:FRG domain-containing protein [Pantoea sp. AS-PWVM4]